MKKELSIAVLVASILTQPTVGLASSYDTWKELKTNDAKKRWRVEFNKELDEFSFSDNIKLFMGDQDLYYEYGLENANKTLVIVSGEGDYKEGVDYRIELDKGLKSLDGSSLKKKLLVPFKFDGASKEEPVGSIKIGSRLDDVKKIKGRPNRVDNYGDYSWYSYFDKSYKEYDLYHIRGGRVEHILTSKRHLIPEKDITWNSTRADVEKKLGISKFDDYIIGGQKVEFSYDKNDGRIINMITSEKGSDYWSIPFDEKLMDIYELHIFDMTNAFRAKKGLGAFQPCKKADKAAKDHSMDMVTNDFLGHVSHNGDTLETRLKRNKISYMGAGENVAGGTRMGGLGATIGWINSPGHRANMLGEFKYMGVGGAIGSWNKYTQVFYRD